MSTVSRARLLEDVVTTWAIKLGSVELPWADESDTDLAELHSMLADLKAAAATMQAEITRTMYDRHLDEHEFEVEGVGTVNVGKPRRKVRWDVDRLLSHVRKAAEDPEVTADPNTGEIPDPVDALFDLMRQVVPCSPSTAFKTSGVKALGLDPDDLREHTWGDPTMSVTRGDR